MCTIGKCSHEQFVVSGGKTYTFTSILNKIHCRCGNSPATTVVICLLQKLTSVISFAPIDLMGQKQTPFATCAITIIDWILLLGNSAETKMAVNKILPYDATLLRCNISLQQLNEIAKEISSRGQVTGLNKVVWAFKALTLTDLTTLAGDDTASNVRRLCHRAAYPMPVHLLKPVVDPELMPLLTTAAVCVYPARVGDAWGTFEKLGKSDIPIAAVATGFPTGQYGLKSRLDEIRFAIEQGASEIDIVINRQLALVGDWQGVYDEVCEMRRACGDLAKLKTILAIGELGSMENVYKASMVCMMAGADFIKTSTGKEAVNATLPVGLVMINAIREFKTKTGVIVGLKPAGGVRTVDEAITWLTLVKETLGPSWLRPELFRFGASGLLDDIEKVVREGLLAQEVKAGAAAAY